jgi:hypothetical protein
VTLLDDVWTVEEVLQTKFHTRTIREMMSQPPPIVTGANNSVVHARIPQFIQVALVDEKGGNSRGVAMRTAVAHGYSIIVHKHHKSIVEIGRMWHTLLHSWHPDVITLVYRHHFSHDGFASNPEEVSVRLPDKIHAAMSELLVERLRLTTADAMNACLAASISTAGHVDPNIEQCNQFVSAFDQMIASRYDLFRVFELGLEHRMVEKNEAERQQKAAAMGQDPQVRFDVIDGN